MAEKEANIKLDLSLKEVSISVRVHVLAVVHFDMICEEKNWFS